MAASVAVLQALALVASNVPSFNSPIPIYAILASDTFIPLTIPSSWGDFAYKYDTQITDYPQERGAFQPYNKIKRPAEITVTLIKTGSDLARLSWLAAVQQQEALNPQQLYTILSPQLIATDYAIANIAYDTRPDRGTNILYLTIKFTQIPQLPSSLGTYNSTLEAKSTPTAQLGQLYTNAANLVQTNLINVSSIILE